MTSGLSDDPPAAPAQGATHVPSLGFLGTYAPRLDDKGRLILPAKYRERLAAGLVIARGQERCLSIWPAADFVVLQARVEQAPMSHRAARNFSRLLLSGASDELPDRQGRITVPPILRAYAGLVRDCAVVGMGNRVEVWDAGSWDRYLAASEQAYADQEEEVLPGLF